MLARMTSISCTRRCEGLHHIWSWDSLFSFGVFLSGARPSRQLPQEDLRGAQSPRVATAHCLGTLTSCFRSLRSFATWVHRLGPGVISSNMCRTMLTFRRRLLDISSLVHSWYSE